MEFTEQAIPNQAQAPVCSNAFFKSGYSGLRRHWEVARWGRLLTGLAILLFTGLGLLHHPFWLAGTLGVAINLVTTSVTDYCVIRNFLLRLGAREREDLFLPGGKPRT